MYSKFSEYIIYNVGDAGYKLQFEGFIVGGLKWGHTWWEGAQTTEEYYGPLQFFS